MKFIICPILVTVILVAMSVGEGGAQRNSRTPNYRLDRRKPTVFLTVSQVLSATVKFDLHNNTRWEIQCYRTPEKLSDTVPIIYKLEERSGKSTIDKDIGDVILPWYVKPGETVTFVVPKENLVRHGALYVEFNYIWEYRDGINPYAVEPNHRVYFFSANLRPNM